MSVNVKTTDGLQKIASNVSIAQADWRLEMPIHLFQ